MSSLSLSPSNSLLDADGRVKADLPCVSCGYNLRTLPKTGLCPECAAPVADSLRGQDLRLAPSAQLKRTARGTQLLILSFVAAVFAWVSYPVLALVFPPPWSYRATWWMQATLVAIAYMLPLAFLAIGAIQLTGREPGIRRQPFVPWAIRICLVTPAVWWLADFRIRAVFVAPLSPRVLAWLYEVREMAAVVAVTVLPLLLTRLLLSLARRLSSPVLLLFGRVQFVGTAGVSSVVLARSALLFLGERMRLPVLLRPAYLLFLQWAPTIGLISLYAGLVLLASGAVFLTLLYRALRAVDREQAQIAVDR